MDVVEKYGADASRNNLFKTVLLHQVSKTCKCFYRKWMLRVNFINKTKYLPCYILMKYWGWSWVPTANVEKWLTREVLECHWPNHNLNETIGKLLKTWQVCFWCRRPHILQLHLGRVCGLVGTSSWPRKSFYMITKKRRSSHVPVLLYTFDKIPVLHPIMPFVTEESGQIQKVWLLQREYPTVNPALKILQLTSVEASKDLTGAVRNARAEVTQHQGFYHHPLLRQMIATWKLSTAMLNYIKWPHPEHLVNSSNIPAPELGAGVTRQKSLATADHLLNVEELACLDMNWLNG